MPGLDLSAGGRLNVAVITTQDASGTAPQLNASDTFTRLNPLVGLTYKILPNLTAYGGYSEANRAPTPLELNCSSSTRPCILASTLISDPPLQQVVSHTLEAGRGIASDQPQAPSMPSATNADHLRAAYRGGDRTNRISKLERRHERE